MVNIEEVLTILKCASQSNTNEHICEEPIMLSCGHYICTRCLEKSNFIKCKTCKRTSERDVNTKQDAQNFNVLLNKYLQVIIQTISDEFGSSIKQYLDILKNNEEILDLRIEFVRDQIQLRIESLKIELDNINDSFNKRLDEMKTKYKERLSSSEDVLTESTTDSQELNEIISKNRIVSQQELYDYQNKVFKLKNTIDEIENEYPKISFNESTESLSKSMIGEIVSISMNNKQSYEEITRKIKEGKHVVHRLDCKDEPFDMCELSNGNLLLANRGLTLFDKKMKIIKSLTSLHDFCNILAIATNGSDEIFCTDYSKNSILKTDLSFNKLAEYGYVPDKHSSQLKNPAGICYYNQFIFVCDFGSKSVQKFDSNLVYKSTYQVGFTPFYIKNCKNVACVRASGSKDLFFYDLNTFTQMRKYSGESGLIGTLCNRFYSYDNSNGKSFYCYDENGEFINQVKVKKNFMGPCSDWGALCFYNSKLFICKRDVSNLIAI